MTEPRQPEDPPSEAKTDTNPHGHAPNGIPHGADEGKAKGTPSSERHETETAATKT